MRRSAFFAVLILGLAACAAEEEPVANRFARQEAEIENKARALEAQVENEVRATEARLDSEASAFLNATRAEGNQAAAPAKSLDSNQAR